MAKIKHGQSARKNSIASPEYRSWAMMKNRCCNPKFPRYNEWGGRGIKVCDRWLKFENFFTDMGKKPSPEFTIDRYPDNDGDYGPTNCRWATSKEQNGNKSSNTWIEYNGIKMILADWATELNANESNIRRYLKSGKEFKWIYEYLRARPISNIPYPRPVKTVVNKTEIKFSSIIEASRQYKISKGTIRKSCTSGSPVKLGAAKGLQFYFV